MFGASLPPDGPLWSFIDDSRTEEGLPSCCCLAPHIVRPHTHTHTLTQWLAHIASTYWNRHTLLHIKIHADKNVFLLFSLLCFWVFFLRCHTFLRWSLLLSGKIQGCTFTPSPSLRHPLPASSSPSYTSCCGVTDSVTQEKTEGETEGGKGKECESLRGVCKTLRVRRCRSAECAATRVNVEYISLCWVTF